jgi:hypothetical protein
MVTQIETTKAPLSFSSPTIVEKRGTKLAASWYIAMHSKLLTCEVQKHPTPNFQRGATALGGFRDL